jgi:O-antigen/teichoic acid export membrane protein
VKHSGILSFRFDRVFSRNIIKQSYPYAILILLMSFYNRIDLVMLERLLEDGKVQAGIYAQSFRILDAAAMFAFLFAGLLLPIFSRMIKHNEPVNEILRLSVTFLILPAISFVLLSGQYGTEIIDLLYNEHLAESSGIFPVLMLTFIFISCTYIFGTLLTAGGNLKLLNLLACITVILNIILNLVFIPKYKAYGSAVSSVISQGFFAISQIILAKQVFKLKINKLFILKIFIFALCLFFTLKMVKVFETGWIMGFFLGIFIAILLAWMIRIITPGDFKKILTTDTEMM